MMHALLQSAHIIKVLPLADRDPHTYVCICTYKYAALFRKSPRNSCILHSKLAASDAAIFTVFVLAAYPQLYNAR